MATISTFTGANNGMFCRSGCVGTGSARHGRPQVLTYGAVIRGVDVIFAPYGIRYGSANREQKVADLEILATLLPAMTTIPTVLRTYIEGLKAHNVYAIAGTVADALAFVTVTTTLNKNQFLAMLRALYAGFPDWHYDHDAPEVRDGLIAVWWRQGGTHSGTLALPGITSIPATGIKVVIPEQYFFYRLNDDRISEIRPDPIPGGAPRGILDQIGVTVSPL